MQLKNALFLMVFFIVKYSFSQNSVPNTLRIVEQQSTDSTIQLYLDPLSLSDEQKTIFIKALSELAIRKNIFDTIKIKPAETVSSILGDNYNYYAYNGFGTKNLLQTKIKEVNGLDSNYKIIKGNFINIPLIPNNPIRTSSKSFAQVLDFIASKTFVSSINNLVESKNIPINEESKKINPGLWMYNISKDDLSFILGSIPTELKEKLYGKGYVVIDDPEFIEVGFPSIIEEEESRNNDFIPLSTNLKDKMSSLRSHHFGKYFILDFFNGEKCLHGKKVVSVVSQRLKEYGLDSLKINILSIPINFFQNQNLAIDILKKYYSSQFLPKLTKIEGEACINALLKIRDNNIRKCDSCVPEIFLDACIKYYYALSPDIISTSFYVTTFRDIMPNFVSRSTTNIISACLNDPGRKIEDLFDRELLVEGDLTGSIQPLTSLYNQYSRNGAILVGCLLDRGKYYGMYSSSGDGITTLGKGTGWGTDSDCLLTKEKGASFATPDVAIKLLIAKAYWKSKNFKPQSTEARTRVVMCSDIDTALIGKFASSGQINLEKLLIISDGFIEKNDGTLNECTIDKNSFIEFDENTRLQLKRGSLGISGLTFVDNTVLAFFEKSLSWKPINIKKLSILLRVNGVVEEYKSIEAIKSSIRQIIVLQ